MRANSCASSNGATMREPWLYLNGAHLQRRRRAKRRKAALSLMLRSWR